MKLKFRCNLPFYWRKLLFLKIAKKKKNLKLNFISEGKMNFVGSFLIKVILTLNQISLKFYLILNLITY